MTPEQFVAWAEEVFGKYLPAMKAEVTKWLAAHTSWFVAGMRSVALREHPSVYGKPPGVYELEQFKIHAFETGHTLEAISAARGNTTLLSTDSAEEYVTPEEGLKYVEAAKAQLNEKIAKMRKDMGLPS